MVWKGKDASEEERRSALSRGVVSLCNLEGKRLGITQK